MTRQELERLASEEPQKLALLFAQKVAGYPEAAWCESKVDVGRLYDKPWIMTRAESIILPDYLNNWTAVINTGKKVGIEWDRVVQRDSFPTYWAYAKQTISNPLKLDEAKCIHQQPDWPDCAALMIVMIEVMEETKQ